MAAPAPTPQAGDVWGQALLDHIDSQDAETLSEAKGYTDTKVQESGGVVPPVVALAGGTDKLTSITVNDDGTATAGWPNRWEWLYKPAAGVAALVQWVNEYGEWRGIPAKANTIAWRLFTKDVATSPARTYANVAEVQDDRTTRTILWAIRNTGGIFAKGDSDFGGTVTAVGKVSAPNIGSKVSVGTTAPASPADGDVWFDIS
jgi:hypothetical protein